MDLNLEFDGEREGILRLGDDRAELLVQPVFRRLPVSPVELQDAGRNHDRFVDRLVDALLAGANHVRPDTFMARIHDGTELVGLARRVDCRKADVGLDDSHLSLLDDQHLADDDIEEERVDGVVTRHQNVVLKTASPAFVQECLSILIVGVQRVLVAQNGVDNDRRFDVCRLEILDVLEVADTARDGARLERRPIQRCHDADVVGRNREVLECLLSSHGDHGLGVLVDGTSVDGVDCHHDERIRVDGVGTWRQNMTLDALLSAVVDEVLDVLEVAESGVVDGAGRTSRDRGSHLGDDDADGLVGHADDRDLADLVHGPEPQMRAGGQ